MQLGFGSRIFFQIARYSAKRYQVQLELWYPVHTVNWCRRCEVQVRAGHPQKHSGGVSMEREISFQTPPPLAFTSLIAQAWAIGIHLQVVALKIRWNNSEFCSTYCNLIAHPWSRGHSKCLFT